MLSVASLAQGPGYYLELANINYYTAGGEPPPTWHGTAAREFGLSGMAERSHVEWLCSGGFTTRRNEPSSGTPGRTPETQVMTSRSPLRNRCRSRGRWPMRH